MPSDNWSRHFTTITQKTKQRWRIREDGDTTRTQEIVHMGQQKVKRV